MTGFSSTAARPEAPWHPAQGGRNGSAGGASTSTGRVTTFCDVGQLVAVRAVRDGGGLAHGRTFHDLRGKAVLMLNMAGATEAEIATITGPSLRDVRPILDKHYSHRNTRLADAGIDKVDAMIAATGLPANDVAIGAARGERQSNGFTGREAIDDPAPGDSGRPPDVRRVRCAVGRQALSHD